MLDQRPYSRAAALREFRPSTIGGAGLVVVGAEYSSVQVKRLVGLDDAGDSVFSAGPEGVEIGHRRWQRLERCGASIAHSASRLPPTEGIAGEFSVLHGPLAVRGASGPLALPADCTNDSPASDPHRKPVPILQLNDNGTSSFKTLEWPPWPSGLPRPY